MDLASAGPLEVKFIITLRRSTPVIEYRRFEFGPPGESKLPLSNRKYTDFFEISHDKNFYKLCVLATMPPPHTLIHLHTPKFQAFLG